MGAAPEPQNEHSSGLSSESVHKRTGHVLEKPFAAHGKDVDCKDADNAPPASNDIEETIRNLPSWQSQLSLRGYIVGECAAEQRAVRARCSVPVSCTNQGPNMQLVFLLQGGLHSKVQSIVFV
jgi:hypothetical protein